MKVPKLERVSFEVWETRLMPFPLLNLWATEYIPQPSSVLHFVPCGTARKQHRLGDQIAYGPGGGSTTTGSQFPSRPIIFDSSGAPFANEL